MLFVPLGIVLRLLFAGQRTNIWRVALPVSMLALLVGRLLLPAAPAAPALPACARRAPGQGARPLAGPSTGSTVALARAGEHLIAYVADEDEGALRTVDVDAQRELSRVALGGRPSALLLAPDGRIVVALRDGAALRVFEPPADPAAEPAPLCQVETATEPVSLAATPDGATLLVVSRWDHTLGVRDLATMRARRSVDLPRDPQAVVASADGTKALVTHLAGAQLSVVDLQGEAAAPRALGDGDPATAWQSPAGDPGVGTVWSFRAAVAGGKAAAIRVVLDFLADELPRRMMDTR